MKPAARRIALFFLPFILLVVAFGLPLRAEGPQAVGAWAPAGPVADSRSGAAAVTLPDGRSLIAGGVTTDGQVTDSVVYFDPTTQAFSPGGALQAPRAGHGATLLKDGRVLVSGGTVDGQPSADLEVFDPTSGESTMVALLSQPRAGHGTARLPDGTVLLVGGTSTDGAVLASAEIFDPETASVVPLSSSLGTPRTGASVTNLIDGRVLIAGGTDGTNDLASAEIYDASANSFSPTDTTLSVARHGHTALLLDHNNSVLISGGVSGGNPVAAADLFKPALFPDPYSWGMGHFAPTRALADARAQAVGLPAGVEGYALVQGGGPATAEAYRFATIKTDKDDYAPGERAVISGSGWQPGEQVTLVFQEDPAVHDDYTFPLTADDQGNIYSDQWAPEHHDIGVRFYLMAYDSQSRAQTTFTDAPKVGSVTVGGQSPDPVAPGSSAAYTVIVNRGSGSGSSGNFTATLSVTSILPAGATASFSPNPVSLGPNVSSATSTLTISTLGTTPGGATPITLKAATSASDFATTTGSLNVDKADATCTISGYNGTYDAAAHGATGSCKGVGGVNLSGLNLGDTFTDVSGGTAHWTFSGGTNYKDQSGDVTIVINKADATVRVNGSTGTYDASAHGAAGTATGVGGVDLSASLNLGATFTAVPGGTAHWTFTGGINYNDQSGDVAIVITKADAVVAVNGYTGVYDTAAHGATGTATSVGGVNLSADLNLGATFTDVPGGTAHWTFTGGTNYIDQSGTAAIVINKADATVTVTGYTGVYNGAPHGATGTATGVGGVDLSTGLKLGANFSDVPGGTAHWTFTGGTNYNDKSGDVAIVINKADATVAVSGYTGVYDAAAHGATGTAKGIDGVDLSAGLNLGATFTDVPGGTANWTFTGGTNYNNQNGTAAIVITKADATVTVTGYTGVYDAAAHGATGTATGVGGVNLTADLNLGAPFTNVPGGTAHWTFAGGTNYNDKSGDVAIVINKADATVAVSGYTGVYDAAAHGATGTASGVGGVNLTADLNLGAPFTNVPGGTAHWTFAGGTNYNDKSGDVAILITKADATVTVTGYTGVYDAAPHGATGTATGVGGANLKPDLSLGATFTNVPGGTAHWTFTGGTNYNDQSGTAAIVINKADVTVVVTPYSLTYDGLAHTATGTAKGVKAENLSGLDLSGTTHTKAGSYSDSWTFTDVTGNYNNASGTAVDAIEKATLTVTADDKTKVLNASNPVFTATYAGFKNGEALATSGVTGAPSLTTTAPQGSVGIYPIVASVGTLAAGNYAFAFVNGSLSITYASYGGVCLGELGHQVLQPINADGTSVFKQKSTVPTKFRVCDANGVSIGTPGVVTSFFQVLTTGGTLTEVDEPVVSTTPDASFRWDPAAQQWIFNAATKNLSANMTYYYRITLNDGSTIDYHYGLK